MTNSIFYKLEILKSEDGDFNYAYPENEQDVHELTKSGFVIPIGDWAAGRGMYVYGDTYEKNDFIMIKRC